MAKRMEEDYKIRKRYVINSHVSIPLNEEVLPEYASLKKECGLTIIDNESLPDLSDEDIAGRMCQVNSIGLEVTQACNFRCGYCSYSGLYAPERCHANLFMVNEVAIGAVEHFLAQLHDNRRATRDKRLGIAFYGGEPLLAFPLVQRTVLHGKAALRELGLSGLYELDFRIATNGSLLTPEVVDWCVSEDIALDISLDGPQEVHDRFRVFADGETGTWKTVVDKVRDIQSRYPAFFSKKVTFQCTVHPWHNQESLQNFFVASGWERVKYNPVNRKGLDPRTDALWFASPSSAPHVLLEQEQLKAIEKKTFLRFHSQQERFTASCFPGAVRVLVDVHGDFHVCEKINRGWPIGSVQKGYDYAAIRRMWGLYQQEIRARGCKDCPAWALCSECLASSAGEEGFCLDCEARRKGLGKMWGAYIANKERGDDAKEYERAGVSAVPAYLDRL